MRILITGANPTSYTGRIKSTGTLTFASLLHKALEAAGHIAVVMEPNANYELEGIDVVMLGIPNFRALSTNRTLEMFHLFDIAKRESKSVFWFLDTWKTDTIKASLGWYEADVDNISDDHSLKELQWMERAMECTVRDFLHGESAPVIIPAFNPGREPSMRKLHARFCGNPVLEVDPTWAYRAHMDRQWASPAHRMERNRRWVCASLEDASWWLMKQSVEWPLTTIGFPDTGVRMSEWDVKKAFASNWGVLIPAHSTFTGSLWRAQFVDAIIHGAVPYTTSAEYKRIFPLVDLPISVVEKMSIEELDGVAVAQQAQFNDETWSREQLIEEINLILEGGKE